MNFTIMDVPVTVALLCLGLTLVQQRSEALLIPEEAYYTTTQLLKATGYPNEVHNVTTEDGYILQIHRITGGRNRVVAKVYGGKLKRVVLFVHGLASSSGDYLLAGPDKSYAYKLADMGYDVWLGNLRSTMYTSHVRLEKYLPEYWNFSFHEHGKYDTPAIINKILEVTGVSKLLYVGHSMGCPTFFTMISERPEYNDKIVSFIGLAPAVYMESLNKNPAFNYLMDKRITERLRSVGINYITLRKEQLIKQFCNSAIPQENACVNAVSILFGEDIEQEDMKMIITLLMRLQDMSLRQLEHFAKSAVTGEFSKFEDGIDGRVVPYKLENVKVPVNLLYGDGDTLTTKSGTLRLAAKMNSTGVLESVGPATTWIKFNHIDFLIAKDLDTLLTKPLVQMIENMFVKYFPN